MNLKKSSLIFFAKAALVIVIAALVVVPVWKRRGPGNLRELANLLPASTRPAEIDPWTAAAEKVKEDRGEPVGKLAKIDTPSELRHYSDTRRFLAMQVAEVKEHQVTTPQDFVDLAAMINRGELVQVPSVTENYVLFGVGGNADSGPFTRYEKGKSISLFNEAGLRDEYARLGSSAILSEKQLANLKQQLAGLKKRDRSHRAQLQKEIVSVGRELKANKDEKLALDHYYGTEATRRELFADYDSLADAGSKLASNGFDLRQANARRQLKVRLLSSLRPEALKVLEEIATAYRQQFARPLPVTSLVRPDEYQLDLSKSNPNATRIDTPPHSTGLAFDILYGYMNAAEQSFVMAQLAQLKDAGRIEVLRENRNHYHVFAFVDGARPHEDFVAAALGEVRPERAATVATARQHAAKDVRQAHHASKKKSVAKAKTQHAQPSRRTRSKSRR